MFQEACRIYREYGLNQNGVSYLMQGIHIGDGVSIPSWKLDEHLLAHKFYSEEYNAKVKKQQAKQKKEAKRGKRK